MSNFAIGFYTHIPDILIDEIIECCEKIKVEEGTVGNDLAKPVLSKKYRNSLHGWIPATEWLVAYLWFYVQKANRLNYGYDILGFDGEAIQYSVYEKGMYYNWHADYNSYMRKPNMTRIGSSFSEEDAYSKFIHDSQMARKLSFSLQLSNEDEYEGGDLQFYDNTRTLTAPKEKGSLVVFDSRVSHRVRKIKSGIRKSIVGWAVGPAWK